MKYSSSVFTVVLAAAVAAASACAQSADREPPDGDAAEPGNEVQQGIAEVNGTRLYYELAGAGPPVVLIHGNLGDRRHWDAPFEAFVRAFRVLRYDLRGFGRSAVPVEGQAYAHHQDLAVLMRHLGIESAHIVGLSMGSAVATDFVLAHPEMSRSLVSVGPWVSGYQSSSDDVKAMYAAFAAVRDALAADGAEAAVDAWMTSPYWRQTMADTIVRARFRAIARDYGFWGFTHADPEVAMEPRTTTQVGSIAVPTLILTAEHDASREVADFLERSVPGARKVVIPGAGHFVQMERPEEFNRLVIEFLREVEAATSER